MASIVRKAVIEAPAARCWDVLRDFSALPERLARGFVTGLTRPASGSGRSPASAGSASAVASAQLACRAGS